MKNETKDRGREGFTDVGAHTIADKWEVNPLRYGQKNPTNQQKNYVKLLIQESFICSGEQFTALLSFITSFISVMIQTTNHCWLVIINMAQASLHLEPYHRHEVIKCPTHPPTAST